MKTEDESELLEAEPASTLLPEDWDELTDEERAEYERLENQERLEESSDRHAEAKRQQNDKGVIRAYADYKRRLPGSGDRLWRTVHGFAKTKIRSRAWDYGNNTLARTPDDAAADVTLNVWKQLEDGKFRGQTGRDFLRWLKRICFCASCKYLTDCIKNKAKFDRLYKDGNDGPYENRDIYRDEYHQTTERYIRIPAWITGEDRYICKLIMDGKKYEEVGKFVGISEAAVKMRVARMRKRAARN